MSERNTNSVWWAIILLGLTLIATFLVNEYQKNAIDDHEQRIQQLESTTRK